MLKRCLSVLMLLLFAAPVFGQVPDIAPLVTALAKGDFAERDAAITALAQSGDARVPAILNALVAGALFVDSRTDTIVRAEKSGDAYTLTNPLDAAPLGDAQKSDLEKIKVNNALRGKIKTLIGQMTLLSPDRATRLSAAQSVLKTASLDMLDLLKSAHAAEADPEIKAVMALSLEVLTLKSDASLAEKTSAVDAIVARQSRAAQTILLTANETAADDVKPLIEAGIATLSRTLGVWDIGQNIWYGLSLGSVLLLAAIGLAITFGVMGVINMAHGEMVMLGAYTTFTVQTVLRTSLPGLADYSLLFALPLAFLFTAACGIIIERGIIRWLYGRPLETLLATWGLSLILQQAVRTVFGPTNRLVDNPSWMSGAFQLGELVITWNRLWIVIFALVVFLVLLIALNRTPLGLQMRAVTQNRRMASAMGIRTPFVDALTFGLGSGIAGLAGVALSQIDNVSPNLGQGYIIDSFMVVVFGGVGNLFGTLVGALSLGVANKFMEPYLGAVVAKIVILVLIILFIQRRPRGLFALKGRFVGS